MVPMRDVDLLSEWVRVFLSSRLTKPEDHATDLQSLPVARKALRLARFELFSAAQIAMGGADLAASDAALRESLFLQYEAGNEAALRLSPAALSMATGITQDAIQLLLAAKNGQDSGTKSLAKVLLILDEYATLLAELPRDTAEEPRRRTA